MNSKAVILRRKINAFGETTHNKKQKNVIKDRIIEECDGTTLSHFVC